MNKNISGVEDEVANGFGKTFPQIGKTNFHQIGKTNFTESVKHKKDNIQKHRSTIFSTLTGWQWRLNPRTSQAGERPTTNPERLANTEVGDRSPHRCWW